jgi:hypothetical protein
LKGRSDTWYGTTILAQLRHQRPFLLAHAAAFSGQAEPMVSYPDPRVLINCFSTPNDTVNTLFNRSYGTVHVPVLMRVKFGLKAVWLSFHTWVAPTAKPSSATSRGAMSESLRGRPLAFRVAGAPWPGGEGLNCCATVIALSQLPSPYSNQQWFGCSRLAAAHRNLRAMMMQSDTEGEHSNVVRIIGKP